jgi:hypothetical protein
LEKTEASTEAILDRIEAVTDFEVPAPGGWPTCTSPVGVRNDVRAGSAVPAGRLVAGDRPRDRAGVGAAVVLLVEVQFLPSDPTVGGVGRAVLAIAFGFTVWQWFRVDELLVSTDRAEFLAGFLPFGQMVVMDHGSVLARFVLLAVAALGSPPDGSCSSVSAGAGRRRWPSCCWPRRASR